MGRIAASQNGSKKEAITSKAAALFIRKGFSSTSMRDIADAIGVEAPSLYNYIRSKNDLLEEVCFQVADRYLQHLKLVESSRAGHLGRIESIIRFHITMMIQEFDSSYLAEHEWIHLPAPLLADFKAQRKNYRQRVAAIVRKGIDRKEIRRIHPDVAVHTMLAAIQGIEGWHRSGRKLDPATLEDNMVQFLINGLKK